MLHPTVAQRAPPSAEPSQLSPLSTTPSPQRLQPLVSNVQSALHPKVPVVKPRVVHVFAPSAEPSHCSLVWLMLPSPHVGEGGGTGAVRQLAASGEIDSIVAAQFRHEP